ncbi:MAG: hypothetical protein KGL39_08765 [Patescibacteria group bacterium]|nr:hypothetical protein [Patescibacteria group bacterium]
MTTNAPVLNAESLRSLSDEQIVRWYSRHPNPTVRALVERLGFVVEKHKGELVQSYQDGFYAAIDSTAANEEGVHRLTPEELRLGALFEHAAD